MTRLYLDTEFNGHGGELISMALASEDEHNWYVEFDTSGMTIHPWVKEHVLPLFISYPCDMEPARKSLRSYLAEKAAIDGKLEIYADWPADFTHLINMMVGDTFEESWIQPCSMNLVRVMTYPENPHNALSDAKALRDALMPRF